MHFLLSSIPKNKTIQQKVKYRLGQVGSKLLGAVQPFKQKQLPHTYNFDAHIFSKQFVSTHYGVMIPDLPEPFRYMSYASVIGDVGANITKTSKKITNLSPEQTVTFVHGTALSTTKDAFKIYSLSEQLKFQQKPFQVQYAEDSTLSEEEDHFYLLTRMDDFEVDLILKPTKALTWFAYSRFYQHFSVMMEYKGTITQQGITENVKGLCTLEHFKSVAISMLPAKFTPQNLTMPMTSFSYQVINLNDQEQLVLAFVGFLGEPTYTAVSYRHIDGTSIQYDDAVFKVIALNIEPQVTPDGFVMQVAQSFQWVVQHENQKVLDMIGVVDTPYCYGLAAGFVSSYYWSGEFKGQKAEGRGYLEYIDRR